MVCFYLQYSERNLGFDTFLIFDKSKMTYSNFPGELKKLLLVNLLVLEPILFCINLLWQRVITPFLTVLSWSPMTRASSFPISSFVMQVSSFSTTEKSSRYLFFMNLLALTASFRLYLRAFL